jgi:Carboxypeptidase regulatory-like domain
MRHLALLVFATCVFCCISSVASASARTAEVSGLVTDTSGARIAEAFLIFESEGQTYRVWTNESGAYSINLAPGTYTVSVSGRPGFCQSRRGDFVAQEGSKIQFNFEVWVCPSDTTCCYNYAELQPGLNTQLKPLILYGDAQNDGDLQTFTGAYFFNSDRHPVLLTYNLLTVRSDKMVYDGKNHLITAIGHVVWADGTKSGTSDKVEIKFDGVSPKLKL